MAKTWVFCCTVYTDRKTHNIRGFGTKSACAKKPESHTSVLVSGAHARLLSTFDRTRVVAHYVAGRGRVIPLKVTYHVTKNPNNTGEIGASVYIGKNPVKFRRSFKKSRCGWVFRFGFLECFRGSCLASSNFQRKTRNARKIQVFLCQCKRHLCGKFIFQQNDTIIINFG